MIANVRRANVLPRISAKLNAAKLNAAQLHADPIDSRLSWLEYVSLTVPFGVAALALATKLLGLIIDRALFVGAPTAAVGMALAVWLDPVRPRRLPLSRWRPQAIALALSQVLVASTFVRRIGTGLVPRAASSDFGSHGGIVTWIAENNAMPSPSRWSATLAAYPAGGHLSAAFLALIAPLAPLQALWVVTLAALIGTWLILCVLARHLAIQRPWLASALVLFFIFSAYRYTVGIVTYDYFFAQLTGQWLALAGVARIVVGLRHTQARGIQDVGDARRPRPQSRSAVAPIWVAVSLAGSVLCYPQSSVLLLGCIGAVVLFGPLPRRIRYFLMAGAVLVGLAFLLVLSRTVYWNVQLLAGIPGEVAHIRLADVGGPVGVGLGVAGLAVVLRSSIASPWAIPFAGAAAGPLGVVAGMLALRSGVPVQVNVSDYRVAKNVYGLAPLGVVCAALATSACVGWVLDHLPRLSYLVQRSAAANPANSRGTATSWLQPIGAGVAACIALGVVRAPTVAVRRIYDADLYQLGRSLPEQQRISVGLVAPWVEVNIMRWAGIGPPVDDSGPAEFPRTERWRKWPDPAVETDYLLVSGPFARRYSARPGVVVERRLGSAVLLKRTNTRESDVTSFD